MSEEDSDELIPHEVIEPLVNWMAAEGYARIHLVARAMPEPADREPLRDETEDLLYCDSPPDSPALLDVYVVSDGRGAGRINGPSSIPPHVLRPLVQALDRASVAEFVIAAHQRSPFTGAPVLASRRYDDFEEYEVPAAGLWPIFAFISTGGA